MAVVMTREEALDQAVAWLPDERPDFVRMAAAMLWDTRRGGFTKEDVIDRLQAAGRLR